MSFFKNWLNRIFKRRLAYQGPFLRPSYNVSDEDGLLATLTHPVIPGQFWIEFVLTPVTENCAKIGTLYSSAFWESEQIIVTEADSGVRVSFFLSPYAIDADDESEDPPEIDYMQSRPNCVVLRGPYPPLGQQQTMRTKP